MSLIILAMLLFCSIFLFERRTNSVPDKSTLLFHVAVLVFFVPWTLSICTSLAIVSAILPGTEQGVSLSCTYVVFRFLFWELMVNLEACKAVVYMLFTSIHWFPFAYIARHLLSNWEVDLVDVDHPEFPCTPLLSPAYSTFCHPEILSHCSFFLSSSLMRGFPMEPWGILFLNFCSGDCLIPFLFSVF